MSGITVVVLSFILSLTRFRLVCLSVYNGLTQSWVGCMYSHPLALSRADISVPDDNAGCAVFVQVGRNPPRVPVHIISPSMSSVFGTSLEWAVNVYKTVRESRVTVRESCI